jgi:hypothetical protein
MNKNTSLTKTCSSCGLEKPLSAFLQIAGPEGTMYGNLCASCRSGKLDKPKPAKEPDETTTSATGLKIDSKVKAKSEKDKALFHKEREEKELKEQEKKKEENLVKTEKVEHKLHSERKHREGFLQNRVFSDKTPEVKKGAAGPTADPIKTFKEEKAKHDAIAKEELQAKGHNVVYGQVELPSQTGALVKNQGVSFQYWLRSVVGPNAAMTKAFGVDKQINKKIAADKKAPNHPEEKEEKDLGSSIKNTFRRK